MENIISKQQNWVKGISQTRSQLIYLRHLATLKDNEKVVYACKLIAKQSIIEKLKKSNNPDSRKEYIINSLKKEVKFT